MVIRVKFRDSVTLVLWVREWWERPVHTFSCSDIGM
jgi:hypothetical protein